MTPETTRSSVIDRSRGNITYVRERYASYEIPGKPSAITSLGELFAHGSDKAWEILEPQADIVTDAIREFIVPDLKNNPKLTEAVNVLSEKEKLDATLRQHELTSLKVLEDDAPDVWDMVGKLSHAHASVERALIRYWTADLSDEECQKVGVSKNELSQVIDRMTGDGRGGETK